MNKKLVFNTILIASLFLCILTGIAFGHTFLIRENYDYVKTQFGQSEIKLFMLLRLYIITFISIFASIIFLGTANKVKKEDHKTSIDNPIKGLYFATFSIFIWGVGGCLRCIFWNHAMLIDGIALFTSTINNMCLAGLIPHISLDKEHTIGTFSTTSIKKHFFQGKEKDNVKTNYYLTIGLIGLIVVIIGTIMVYMRSDFKEMLDCVFSTSVDIILLGYLIFAFREREMPAFVGFSIFTILITIFSQLLKVSAIRPYFDSNLFDYLNILTNILFIFCIIVVLFALVISYTLQQEKREREIAEEQRNTVTYLKIDLQHRIKDLFKGLESAIHFRQEEYRHNESQLLAKEMLEQINIRRKIHEVLALSHDFKHCNLIEILEYIISLQKEYGVLIHNDIALSGMGLEEVPYQINQSLAVLLNELLTNARKYGLGEIDLKMGSQSYTSEKSVANDFVLAANTPYLYISIANKIAQSFRTNEAIDSMGLKINHYIVTGLQGKMLLPKSLNSDEAYKVEIYIPISKLQNQHKL